MAMHKYGDLIQPAPWWENLGDAAVRIDLLHVKPSQTVSLNLGTEGNGNRGSNNKGMITYGIETAHNHTWVVCCSVSYY
jgi:hypothetical protein